MAAHDEELPAYSDEAPPTYEAATGAPRSGPVAPVRAAGAAPAAAVPAPTTMGSRLKGKLAKVPGAGKVGALATAVMQTAKRKYAELGIALGLTFKGDSFRTEFAMPDSEPMLGGFSASLLNGERAVKAQLYVTPSFACIYMVTATQTHRIKLPLRDMAHFIDAYCVEPGTRDAAPVIVMMHDAAGHAPNSLILDAESELRHTLVSIDRYSVAGALLHVAWCRSSPHARARVWSGRTDVHTQLELAADDVPLAVFAGSVVSSAERKPIPARVGVTAAMLAFALPGMGPIKFAWRSVERVAPARGTVQADGSYGWVEVTLAMGTSVRPNSLAVHTTDGCIHRVLVASGLTEALNVAIYAWAMFYRVDRPTFRYWSDAPAATTGEPA